MTAPVVVTYDDSSARKIVRDLQGRFASFEPILRGPVRRLLRDAIVRQFRTRGAYSGSPWPPLAASTLRSYEKRSSAHPRTPMRRTDALFRSLTIFSDVNRVETFTKDGYSLESTIAYGKFHQSTAPRTSNLPRRAVVPDQLAPEDERRLRNLVRGYIITGAVAQ